MIIKPHMSLDVNYRYFYFYFFYESHLICYSYMLSYCRTQYFVFILALIY